MQTLSDFKQSCAIRQYVGYSRKRGKRVTITRLYYNKVKGGYTNMIQGHCLTDDLVKVGYDILVNGMSVTDACNVRKTVLDIVHLNLSEPRKVISKIEIL